MKEKEQPKEELKEKREKQRRSDKQQRLTIQVLELFNKPDKQQVIVQSLVQLIKDFTGFEAAAIRLREKDDFPFYASLGLPDHFIHCENSLLCPNKSRVECICGTVASGNTDSKLPCYTKHGSFQTNSITDFDQALAKEMPIKCFRKNCNREGYESQIIIPLRTGDQILGVLQLNDKRKNLFTTDQIEFLEQLSESIAIAIQRMILQQEVKKAKEEAEIANQAKSRFLANMSHELRTPLNCILGYAQILKREHREKEQTWKNLDKIDRSGKHLLSLIDEILDLAKIESGKITLNRNKFHLPTFLKNICQIISVEAEKKSLTLLYQPFDYINDKPLAANMEEDEEIFPSYVRGDEKHLRQILLNLLGNAIKFTHQGTITLKTGILSQKKEGGLTLFKVRFQVDDTGVGIAEEEQDKIFEPFHQAENNYLNTTGTGLGLTISQQFACLMDSQIYLESTVNQGSSFRFDIFLPSVSNSCEIITNSSQQHITGYTGKSFSVLIADRTPESRAILHHLLTQIGFQVYEAENGDEGLVKVKELQPDVLISALSLPGITGLNLIRHTREQLKGKKITIIASSASIYDEDRQKSIIAGADAFLQKPIELEILFDLLQQHLRLQWIYKEKKSDNNPS